MSKNWKRKLLAVVAILLVILGVVYVYIFDPFIEQVRFSPVGLSDFRENTGDYKINPKRILVSLDNGESDALFIPWTATPSVPIFDEPISWQQSDDLKITNALHQFVWKETSEDWSLYYMDFITGCQDSPNGFSLGDFYYFKTIFLTNGKIRYTARELQITPQYGTVTWGDGANFPRSLLGWERVDVDRIAISAEDALRIADENGGRDARLSVQNNCTIQVRLAGYDAGWKVRINENTTASVIFRMEVDPYTGKIK